MGTCIYCGEVAEFLVYRTRGDGVYQSGVFLCGEHLSRVVERDAQQRKLACD